MALSPQSIRKGVKITLNDVEVNKQQVINFSQSWEPNHETLFKKMLKQGGKFHIRGIVVEITLQDKILNSKGESDGGIQQVDPLARF
jgi:hypothetical protein